MRTRPAGKKKQTFRPKFIRVVHAICGCSKWDCVANPSGQALKGKKKNRKINDSYFKFRHPYCLYIVPPPSIFCLAPPPETRTYTENVFGATQLSTVCFPRKKSAARQTSSTWYQRPFFPQLPFFPFSRPPTFFPRPASLVVRFRRCFCLFLVAAQVHIAGGNPAASLNIPHAPTQDAENNSYSGAATLTGKSYGSGKRQKKNKRQNRKNKNDNAKNKKKNSKNAKNNTKNAKNKSENVKKQHEKRKKQREKHKKQREKRTKQHKKRKKKTKNAKTTAKTQKQKKREKQQQKHKKRKRKRKKQYQKRKKQQQKYDKRQEKRKKQREKRKKQREKRKKQQNKPTRPEVREPVRKTAPELRNRKTEICNSSSQASGLRETRSTLFA